jgi:hypothetical protein
LAFSLLLGLVGWLIPAGATAQQFTFKPYDGITGDDLSETELNRFFNMARCLCDEDASATENLSFYVGITSPGPYEDQEIYFLLGDNCDEDVSRPDCVEFDAINYSNFNRQQDIYLPVNLIVDPIDGICEERRDTSTLHLFMDPEKRETIATYAIDYDTKPPGVPTITSVEGGDGAVIVKWQRPDVDDEDIEYYNVLCEVAGAAPDVSSASMADWTTTLEVCDKELSPTFTEPDVDAGVEDGGVMDGGVDGGDATPIDGGVDAAVDAALPDGQAADGAVSGDCVGNLVEGDYPRSCFVCGSTGPTARNFRVDGLPNGVEVYVAVVAIDSTLNVSRISNVEVGTPLPTSDFAEHYRDSGGKGKGGFCFVATTAYGSYDHSHVRVLRRFRDQVLAKSSWGRSFVGWYYRNGRRLAEPFTGRPWARGALRVTLLPLVAAAYLWTHLGGVPLVALLAIAVIGMVAGLRARKRRKRREAEAAPGDTEETQTAEDELGRTGIDK